MESCIQNMYHDITYIRYSVVAVHFSHDYKIHGQISYHIERDISLVSISAVRYE